MVALMPPFFTQDRFGYPGSTLSRPEMVDKMLGLLGISQEEYVREQDHQNAATFVLSRLASTLKMMKGLEIPVEKHDLQVE